jgi:hypothetical protein
MSRRVRIEVTEFYNIEIGDENDGTDAVLELDEMDSDDRAALYQERTIKVFDDSTGEELPVDRTVV